MNQLMLLAQAFLNHQSQQQGENLKQAGLRAAEVGRRLALAGVFFAISGLFIFSAILVAVIEMGRQLEREGSVTFTGLMISATTLIGFAVASAVVGWIIGRDEKAVPQSLPTTTESDSKTELRSLLEAVAVSLLREFMASRERAASENKEASEPPDHNDGKS